MPLTILDKAMEALTSLQKHRIFSTLLIVLPLLAGCSSLGDRIAGAAQRGAERATEREIARRADQATTGAIEGFEDAVRCTVGDSACAERARRENQDIVYVDEDGNPVSTERNAPGNVSADYDFVPGDRVLFEDDFSNDRPGDFPRRLRFGWGSMEVVDWNGQRLLRVDGSDGSDGNRFDVSLPEPRPDRFTVEFDLHDPAGHTSASQGVSVYFGLGDPVDKYDFRFHRIPVHYVQVGHYDHSGVAKGGTFVSSVKTEEIGVREGLVHIAIQVDGDAMKVYAGRRRIANIPQGAELVGGSEITFYVRNGWDNTGAKPIYIGNIRVASGGQDLYGVLQAEGRVAARGILFDTGSSRIRSESASALAEIVEALRQYPDLRLRIEGHTDNAGSTSSNLSLSRQRAEAVRAHLVSQGIDASRLEAAGMGEDHPVADNSTEAGRAFNRRVELVRL